MKTRTIGLVLVAVGVVGLIGIAWGFAASSSGHVSGVPRWGPSGGRGTALCTPHTLPGLTVDVIVSDMGGGMMGGGMMNLTANLSSGAAGDVSFRVWNEGTIVHEFVVLPLPTGGAGTRPIGVDGQVDEAASLGEASNACGEGAGEGIPPGSAGWVTLHLDPGRYELICNLPGHYERGMFAEFVVQ